uniref:Uncharacterized protein n=1 Tax=Ditylum brightwellii TaxID=49249 RepID=A0A6U3SMR2_9STRA|mmetsp:Transcript_6767/g.10218  ORF Transcript_6767/g.10218 Transcript_6767/m.10218 type:complete len:162 (+) Transcript_6767:515-1000(+)
MKAKNDPKRVCCCKKAKCASWRYVALKYEEMEGLGSNSNSWATNLLSSLTGHSNNSSKGTSPDATYASSASSMASSDAQHKVTFRHDVKVVPIPMRNEYSRRLRTRLWAGREELHLNAQRNALEFEFEGWDWRTVTDDDDMYVCSQSGELIHPAHCIDTDF